MSEGFIRLAVLRYCHASPTEQRLVQTNSIIIALGLKFRSPTSENFKNLEITTRAAEAWCIFYKPTQGKYLSLREVYKSSNFDQLWYQRGDLRGFAELPQTDSLGYFGASSTKSINIRLNKKQVAGQLVYKLVLLFEVARAG